MLDLTKLAIGFLTLLFGLAGAYLIPWLKEKLGAEKLSAIAYWVGIFVSAAEQMFTDVKSGAEKLKWVEEQLAARGYSLDTDAVRALIEASVRDLKLEAIAPDPVVIQMYTGEVEAAAEAVDPVHLILPDPLVVGAHTTLSDGTPVIIMDFGLASTNEGIEGGSYIQQEDGTWIKFRYETPPDSPDAVG